MVTDVKVKDNFTDFKVYWEYELNVMASKDPITGELGFTVASVSPLTRSAPPLTPEQLELYPEKLDIEVSREDIFRGRRGDSQQCAVSLAVRRRFDGARVSVNSGNVVIMEDHSGPLMVRYTDPSGELARFVQTFDHPFYDPFNTDYYPRPTTLHLVRSVTQPRYPFFGDIS